MDLAAKNQLSITSKPPKDFALRQNLVLTKDPCTRIKLVSDPNEVLSTPLYNAGAKMKALHLLTIYPYLS